MSLMVILICLASTPRDQCNENTAVQVIKPLDRYPTMMGCAVAAMQSIDPPEGTYPLVRCSQ